MLASLLLLNIDQPPAKLHLHQYTNKSVQSVLRADHKVSAWSIHVLPGDQYKASFTLEDGVAYMRVCDTHDLVDKAP